MNAGGDLRLFGARRETLLLRYPDHSYQPLLLQNAALAVSDLDEPRRPPGHRGYYVRSGDCGGARHYAAVQAPDAMTADALTKCVLLCSEACARRTLAELGGQDLTPAAARSALDPCLQDSQNARQALRQKIDERPDRGQEAPPARKHDVHNALRTVPRGQYSSEYAARQVLAHHALGQPRDP